MELLASTGEVYSRCTIKDSWTNENFRLEFTSSGLKSELEKAQINLFKTCQWTPDGSSLVTSNQDQTIRTFVVPPSVEDACEDGLQKPAELQSYSQIGFPHAVSSLAVYPGFRIAEYSGALVCASVTDHPLQLFNIHNHTKETITSSERNSGVVATYPLTNPNNESMLGTLALAFMGAGELVAGTTKQRGRVCLYDISRPGKDPLHTVELSGRCRPIVSAIANRAELWSESRSLAAGYYNSPYLGGIYDFRSADPVTLFDVGKDDNESHSWRNVGGIQKGVTQLIWSSNGRYLFVVERRATEITVLDARAGFRRLCALGGYKGNTNQRLTGTIVRGYKDGLNYLFLGSTDGSVTVYDEVGAITGTTTEPITSWDSHKRDSNISSVCVNPITEDKGTDSPIIIATTGGQRVPNNASTDDDFSIKDYENSLKVWSIK